MGNTRVKTVVTGAVASMALLLSACGGAENGDQNERNQSAPSQSQQGGDGSGQDGSGRDGMSEQGVTTVDDIYGPAASKVPTNPGDEGSAQGMADDPVATAASNNPLLTNLTKAVKTAGLVDTLNKPDAEYTVFAPADSAFEKLDPATLDALLNDPAKKEQLTNILTYHVVPERMSAEQLGNAGEVETVNGETVPISGSGENIEIDGANVQVGNVPTANATVFVIDEVLMPPKS
ncbi:Uncaracterized surface protein containing fasciclin (FAS1) repeats [Actinopolyspora xinjiangensis]|uniref:Uncaracterized surface protein containing fasciclin (FAS1) repeats n=1 Tax=Actinopolyspora xinjiangensis TaxID=405564 RepID=A0A1H0WNR5_9ACTN|nr:fasciclin domain-containing protein [Actinopolyspora xinjiangensis]SDP92360.1 Uncaracterized surface protein containing fasciclin (FAS1) repeats [Actinopolyspora xinjiangensis]